MKTVIWAYIVCFPSFFPYLITHSEPQTHPPPQTSPQNQFMTLLRCVYLRLCLSLKQQTGHHVTQTLNFVKYMAAFQGVMCLVTQSCLTLCDPHGL